MKTIGEMKEELSVLKVKCSELEMTVNAVEKSPLYQLLKSYKAGTCLCSGVSCAHCIFSEGPCKLSKLEHLMKEIEDDFVSNKYSLIRK